MSSEKHNGYLIFLLFCLIAFLVNYISQEFILSDDIFFNSLGEQLSYNRIQTLLDESKKWRWFSYPIIPLIYFLKFSLITICLLTGLFFWNIDLHITRVFYLVMICEFIFFIPAIIKTTWFVTIADNYTLQDIQTFRPFSVLSFFEESEIETWLVYPMQLINLFELLYIILLSWVISREINDTIDKGFTIVLSSYGSGVMIWIILVTFMVLNFI